MADSHDSGSPRSAPAGVFALILAVAFALVFILRESPDTPAPEPVASTPAASPVASASPSPSPKKAGVPPAPPKPTETPGRKIALLVGIQNYDDPKLPILKYARRDAEKMKEVLELLDYEVILLTDKTKPPATREAILDAFQTLIRTKKQDRTLFFYSGLGAESENPVVFKNKGYLLPMDAKAGAFRETAFPFTAIERASENIPAKHFTVLIDAGFFPGGKSATPEEGYVNKGRRSTTLDVLYGSGRFVMFASVDDEPAREIDEVQHGAFSARVLRSIRFSYRTFGFFSRAMHKGMRQDYEQTPTWFYKEDEFPLYVY